MSQGYTKLFGSIVHSTIWRASAATKVVWVTMLALADADGEVMASVPGLADLSRVTREEVDVALDAFLSPDVDSRSEAFDGRRITKIDGGWRLLNHDKYKNLQTKTQTRKKNAERQARYRDNQKGQSVTVTECHKSNPTQTQTQTQTQKPIVRGTTVPPQDFVPNAKHREIAGERGLLKRDLDREHEMFLDHVFPRPYKDWGKVFNNWLRKANPSRGSAAPVQLKGTRATPGER